MRPGCIYGFLFFIFISSHGFKLFGVRRRENLNGGKIMYIRMIIQMWTGDYPNLISKPKDRGEASVPSQVRYHLMRFRVSLNSDFGLTLF